MSAEPIQEHDPDDPVVILDALPADLHSQFLTEYAAAVHEARHPEQYHRLHDLLRLWRLRAAAYADPNYLARLEEAREGKGCVPAEQVTSDWPRH